MSIADLLVPNSLLSGIYASTWTTTALFTSTPSTVEIKWQRIGNVMQCFFVAYTVGLGNGINTATITLPVARATPFTMAANECSGPVFYYSGTGIAPGFITPMNSTVAAQINMISAGDPGGTISGAFCYTLA